MARVPEATREQLPADQQHVYDEIAASRGSVRGPFAVLLHSPEAAGRTAHLGAYIRFDTSLEQPALELVALTVAREWDCQFEWTAHEPLARNAGGREEAIAALKERRAPAGLTEGEALLVKYAQELLRTRRVSEPTFKAAQDA